MFPNSVGLFPIENVWKGEGTKKFEGDWTHSKRTNQIPLLVEPAGDRWRPPIGVRRDTCGVFSPVYVAWFLRAASSSRLFLDN